MCADNYDDNESFEDTVRDIAREVGKSVERAIERLDLDELAETVGIDPDHARDWMDSAGTWLRAQVERLGEDVASQAGSSERGSNATPGETGSTSAEPVRVPAKGPLAPEDPWRSAAPHPLDLPTDEQGLALAALDSGRWEVEPGTNRLVARGEGRQPSDALGLVRALRARDWITADGEVTVVGRRALGRWLDSSA